MLVAAVHPTCVQDGVSYEVGASIEGARALMAAMDQPSFGQNLPVEVKLEKDHPNVGDGPSKLDKLCTHVHAHISLKLLCQFYLS